ncbi:Helix-loop-helix DNA-binding domain protein [Paragonimus heterotremus]|uniref:Helix-loop-helix DNA-binding domain protein n=1 Tax=Paragonimus heterotremus TaxID=100268 RepID=A0A8J4T019_9TREM|nr:Helix-loop-helix DNA-binding domain protein [Paragonimus heterotremus]
MVENLTASDFSRDSDVGSDRDTLDVPGSQFSLSKRDGLEQHDKERYARESHCEIERRRRNKMTAYINELCEMVPTCSSLARKPDKLTILRMAVSHMKSIRGTGNTGADGSYRPSFLSDQELKHLVLEAADGFLFVCQCDTGRIIYVSDSVTAVLNQTQSEWYQHTLYELCHPDDSEKICEQLTGATLPAQGAAIAGLTDRSSNGSVATSSSTSSLTPCKMSASIDHSKHLAPQGSLSPGEYPSNRLNNSQQHTSPNVLVGSTSPSHCPTRILDLKTGTVKKEGHQSHMRAGMGARRGFICRMRMGSAVSCSSVDVGSTNTNFLTARTRLRHRQTFGSPPCTAGQPTYALIHVTGFVKPIGPTHNPSKSEMQMVNGHPAGSQSHSIFDGLLPNDGDFSLQGHDVDTVGMNEQDKLLDQQVPHCLVALGRLQITNRPDAVDLSPSRSLEFVTRLSSDARVTFCDQRVQNVLGVGTDDILGQLFSDFMPSSKDKANFQELFDRAWKFKGEIFSLLLVLRAQSSGDPVSVRCNLFAFANPFSEEVEYVVCTTTSVKSLQSSVAVAAAACGAVAIPPSTGVGCDTIRSGLHRTSAVFEVSPSGDTKSHLALAFGSQPSQLPSHPEHYNDVFRAMNDTHCERYWRPAPEGQDSFDPHFPLPVQHSLRSLSGQVQSSDFSAHHLHPLPSAVSEHLCSPTATELGDANKTDRDERLLSGLQHSVETQIASNESSDYLHASEGDYLTEQYVTHALPRRARTGHTPSINQAHFYGTHPNDSDTNSRKHGPGVLAPDNCLIRASDSGLTRPSAICYLPSAPVGETVDCELTSMSPSRLHHLQYASSSSRSSIPTLDVYQPGAVDHLPTASSDTVMLSTLYGRSPPIGDPTNNSSVFPTWYSSDHPLTASLLCPSSVPVSSAASEAYRSTASASLHANDLAPVAFNYPATDTNHVMHSSQLLPIIPPCGLNAESCMQPIHSQDYFGYFPCQSLYPSSGDEYRQLASVHAAAGDV